MWPSSADHAFTLLAIVGPLIFFALLARLHSGAQVLAGLLIGIALVVVWFFYRLWFRPVVANETTIRLPTTFFGWDAVAVADVAEIGLRLRTRGEGNSPGWRLEIRDTSGVLRECDGFIYAETPKRIERRKEAVRRAEDHVPNVPLDGERVKPVRALDTTRAGKAAIALHEWVTEHQGALGPLHSGDRVSTRRSANYGEYRPLAFWSPDGQIIFV